MLRNPTVLLLIGCAAACGGAPETGTDAAVVDSAAAVDGGSGYSWTQIGAASHAVGDRTFEVVLARIERPDGGRTYVEWIPSDRAGDRPVVIMTMPYEGIDWTGEELDERWAASAPQPDGRYLDVDGPAFDGTALISYYPVTIESAAESANLHLLNDASVLMVFGRFYAGGSVRDDVEDGRAGTWFVAEQAAVDEAKIGVIGGSWGGFEALYASAFADARVAPSVTVALFPPSDFETWVAHAESRTEPAKTALVPYLRRIGTDFDGLRAGDLCAGLPAATLLLHDDLDNLVPIAQSDALMAECGGIDHIYWRRAGEPDASAPTHGPLLEEPGVPSAYLYGNTYLHRRLAAVDQAVLELYTPAAMAAHLATVHDGQVRGEDVGFAAPRLRELCDPRVYLIDLAAPEVLVGGAAAVAALVNAEWGTSYSAATIDEALASGLPPP